MQAAERDLALQHLHDSRRRLLETVAGLSPEQRSFRPSEDCWSVADCVEYITIVEHFVLDSIDRVLQAPREPEKHAETVGKDRSEEHTSELQSHSDLVCRLLLEKKNIKRVAQPMHTSQCVRHRAVQVVGSSA